MLPLAGQSGAMNEAVATLALGLKVESLARECTSVISVWLKRPDGGALPPVAPGAHIDLKLPNGLVRQYSVIAHKDGAYLIAVQLDAAGRGGSRWLHDNLGPGTWLDAGGPRNHFALEDATRYRFIAGGIGITPILAMLRHVEAQGSAYALFYCTRDEARTPFRDELAAPERAGRIVFVHDGGNPDRGLDVAAAVKAPQPGERLYCCGPTGLMSAVKAAAQTAGWPSDRLHFESFAASPAKAEHRNRAFTAVISSTGQELQVPADKSLLQVLAEAGILIDSACEEGVCGTCAVGVIQGVLDHRDSVLSDAQRAAGNVMQVCCSRALGERIVLDL